LPRAFLSASARETVARPYARERRSTRGGARHDERLNHFANASRVCILGRPTVHLVARANRKEIGQMGTFKRFGLIASFLIIVGASALVGCMRTRYVYVDSAGVTHESNRPLNERDIEIAELRADPDNGSALRGTWTGRGNWTADVPPHHLRITLKTVTDDGTRTATHYVTPSSLTWRGGDRSGRAGFALSREAGTFTFDVSASHAPLKGEVRFTPNAPYLATIRKLFNREFTPAQTLDLAMIGLELSYVRKVHGALDHPSLEDVVMLRRGAVDADYVTGLHKAGYGFDAGDVLSLRRAGVGVDYCVELRKAGFTLPAGEIIALRRAGVSSEFAAGVKESGYGTRVDEIITLRRAGIDVDYLKSFRVAGYGFGSDDMITLRRAGVGADYAAALRKGGYDLPADQLITLRRAGVDADYAIALTAPPRENLTVDEIVTLRRRGIDAETVRKLRR
jgi:hypothetical protein